MKGNADLILSVPTLAGSAGPCNPVAVGVPLGKLRVDRDQWQARDTRPVERAEGQFPSHHDFAERRGFASGSCCPIQRPLSDIRRGNADQARVGRGQDKAKPATPINLIVFSQMTFAQFPFLVRGFSFCVRDTKITLSWLR